MPYTTVVAGTTITASWSNTNNRDQVLTPFASSAARASAITSPVNGMHSYLTDLDRTYVYDGAQWVPANSNVVAYQSLSTNSSLFTGDATSDFSLSSVVVFSTRLYTVNLHSAYGLTAAGSWAINLFVDGVQTNRLFDIEDVGAIGNETISSSVLWVPTTGTKTLDVRLDEGGGAGDIQFNGAATATRNFWVEDIGPR